MFEKQHIAAFIALFYVNRLPVFTTICLYVGFSNRMHQEEVECNSRIDIFKGLRGNLGSPCARCKIFQVNVISCAQKKASLLSPQKI